MVQAGDPGVIHGTAELQPGVKMHDVETGAGPRTIVLLHGHPQTWWEWRHVVPPLAAAGWRVIMPDHRGAGASSEPQEGYGKRTVARDVDVLLGDQFDVCASAFSAAGAMRAGFGLYRAFDRDGDDDRAAPAEAGKLETPVLALRGASSFFAPIAAEMLGEVADDVRTGTIPRCGPWVAEENPAALLGELFRFVG